MVLNFLFGLIGVALVAILVKRKFDKERRVQQARTEGLFEDILALFSDTRSEPGEAAGSWIVSGRFDDTPFQLRSITDTLATRKLPSLWLQVTLQRAQPLSCKIDIMLRPAGLTSFSNFDFLPDRLANPPGAPIEAITKSDNATAAARHLDVLGRHMGLLRLPRAKELLVSPNGLRLVIQAAEASRVRYGVFRQADFEGVVIAPEFVLPIVNGLLALEQDLRDDAPHG